VSNGGFAMKTISIVVPCFNEEANILALYERVRATFERLRPFSFELILVDNGSTDGTHRIISAVCQSDNRVKLVSLSRNFRYEGGIEAGLHYADGDAVIIMDGDLQDPPELIPEFIDKWMSGYNVVYGIRSRPNERRIRRLYYSLFYKVLGRISELSFPERAGNFALMDRRVYTIINQLPEHQKFIRSLRFWAGFKQVGIPYERSIRHKGESKHTFSDALNLAVDGVLSFPSYPISIIFRVAIAFVTLSMMGLFYAAIWLVLYPEAILGYTALLFVMLFIGGLQLLAIGVVGEYIYRILLEVRNRPHFIVAETLNTTYK
jgi:dolichol-phosphate mannosyltransferase